MLPYFFISSFNEGQSEITLDEDNSRHVVQVLRMKPGEALQLTDGKGALLSGMILDDHKKKCRVNVEAVTRRAKPERRVTIAISLLKNTSRFEWFLEKATEIGVTGIVPLICDRTERQHFRHDRMHQILVSALLQSQQVWLPDLAMPTDLGELVERSKTEFPRRFIAHCLEDKKLPLTEAMKRGEGTMGQDEGTIGQDEGKMGQDEGKINPGSVASGQRAGDGRGILLLIGPEGDFSPGEIEMALRNGVVPVTLGETRLRSETAGMVGATLLCIR